MGDQVTRVVDDRPGAAGSRGRGVRLRRERRDDQRGGTEREQDERSNGHRETSFEMRHGPLILGDGRRRTAPHFSRPRAD